MRFLLALALAALAAATDPTPATFRLQRGLAEARSRAAEAAWAAAGRAPPPPQTAAFPLDHNSPFSATFNSTYWVNTAFLNASAPPPSLAAPRLVFLFCCAEETCSAGRTLGGAISALAQQYGAAVVALQHRFYGAAQPFGDRTAEHLAGLVSVHAVSDWALLLARDVLPALNASAPGTHRVVAFGGSYGGQLAAWLRLKHPHLIHAAIASSAPVRTALDYAGYDDVVGRALADPASGGSPVCRDTLAAGFAAAAAGLAGGDAAARRAAVAALHSCTDLTNSPLDPSFGLTSAANMFKGIVQTSGQWFSRYNINQLCGNLSASLAAGGSALGALGDFVALFVKAEFGGSCQTLGYDEFNSYMRNSSIPGPDFRLWYWQTCSEQGKAQVSLSPGSRSPFSSLGQSVQEYYEQCGAVFGEQVGWAAAQRLMRWSETNYGGQGIAASRVVYVNGGGDPFSAGGILVTLDPLQPAVVIPGASHCQDMGDPSANDSPAMQQAHKSIASHLADFLAM